MAHETPFFFEQRRALLWELLRQNRLCHGLPAFLSSKIELLQHQVEIAARILRDPTIRYLLADEVGLGKTIEACIVLRQLRLDAPDVRSAVFVPDALVRTAPWWHSSDCTRFFEAEITWSTVKRLTDNELVISTVEMRRSAGPAK